MSDNNTNKFQLKHHDSLVRKLIEANQLVNQLHHLLSLDNIGADFDMERNDLHYYLKQFQKKEKKAEEGGNK